jgi:PIN domain nuclease of toxin-antitoxin system
LGHVDPVRVVADTHALVWYLLDDPDRRLSPAAITALERAESTDGIAVSVASVVDLWYVIRTRGTFTDEQLDQVLGLLHDSETSLEAAPITLDVTAAFRQIPRDALGDPWDRFITATAMALGLPLVTRDGRIRESGLVDTIW